MVIRTRSLRRFPEISGADRIPKPIRSERLKTSHFSAVLCGATCSESIEQRFCYWVTAVPLLTATGTITVRFVHETIGQMETTEGPSPTEQAAAVAL